MVHDLRAGAVFVVSFVVLVGIAFGTTGWIRGSLGDLVVVIWVASALASVGPGVGRPAVCAGLALTLATALECGQLLGKVDADAPLWMHLIFGSTFDPLDLVHYAIGAVAGWGILRALRREAP